MSIAINQEPITHDYADVEPPKQNAKAKNFTRTFVDQSSFSYFNTALDEDLAHKKLLKRRQTRAQQDPDHLRKQLVLQNGDVIAEDSDELEDISETMASELVSLDGAQDLRQSELASVSKNLCQQIVYDLLELVVETMLEEEKQYDR
jgi:hypothetical protein